MGWWILAAVLAGAGLALAGLLIYMLGGSKRGWRGY